VSPLVGEGLAPPGSVVVCVVVGEGLAPPSAAGLALSFEGLLAGALYLECGRPAAAFRCGRTPSKEVSSRSRYRGFSGNEAEGSAFSFLAPVSGSSLSTSSRPKGKTSRPSLGSPNRAKIFSVAVICEFAVEQSYQGLTFSRRLDTGFAHDIGCGQRLAVQAVVRVIV
jgi:hypothetical protein